jgi:hypothetical protein
VPTGGQAPIHLFFLAALRGLVVRGPVRGREHAYVLVRDWLGEQPPVDRERGLAELARRYLVGHQPASERDLAKWAGLPLRDARAGLRSIGSELEEGEGGLLRLRKRPPAGGLPPPRLLGAFDPVLLGWASREPVLGRHQPRVVTGGIFRPFAIAGGHAVAGWKWARGEVKMEPYERLSARQATALEADADDVQRFLAGGG